MIPSLRLLGSLWRTKIRSAMIGEMRHGYWVYGSRGASSPYFFM
jgi:hypothetical protein